MLTYKVKNWFLSRKEKKEKQPIVHKVAGMATLYNSQTSLNLVSIIVVTPVGILNIPTSISFVYLGTLQNGRGVTGWYMTESWRMGKFSLKKSPVR